MKVGSGWLADIPPDAVRDWHLTFGQSAASGIALGSGRNILRVAGQQDRLGVFSIMLGGKLAGTTAKLASFNDREFGETRRVLRLLGRGAGLLNRAVCRGVAALGEFGRAAARLAWRRAAVTGQQKPPPEGW